jgi:hypothetical protein
MTNSDQIPLGNTGFTLGDWERRGPNLPNTYEAVHRNVNDWLTDRQNIPDHYTPPGSPTTTPSQRAETISPMGTPLTQTTTSPPTPSDTLVPSGTPSPQLTTSNDESTSPPSNGSESSNAQRIRDFQFEEAARQHEEQELRDLFAPLPSPNVPAASSQTQAVEIIDISDDEEVVPSKPRTVITVHGSDSEDDIYESPRPTGPLTMTPIDRPPAPVKEKLTVRTTHPLAHQQRARELEAIQQAAREVQALKEAHAREDAISKLCFDWTQFKEDTTSIESRTQLLEEIKDNRTWTHVNTYSTLRTLQTEADKLHNESMDIRNTMNTSLLAFQEAIQRQDRHAHSLSAFATRLEDTSKKYIDAVPKLNLINQGTQWFLDQQQRRQSASILEHPAGTPAPIDTSRFSTPPPPPPGINPLWAGQSPYFANGRWYSMVRKREKYKDYQCDLCHLHGHIKYDCPKYKCPNCNTACGHRPAKCIRPAPALTIGAVYVDDTRIDVNESNLYISNLDRLEKLVKSYNEEIKRQIREEQTSSILIPNPIPVPRRISVPPHRSRRNTPMSIHSRDDPPPYPSPTPVTASRAMRRSQRGQQPNNQRGRHPRRPTQPRPRSPDYYDDPSYLDDIFDLPEGFGEF